jgi:hypothetical protein
LVERALAHQLVERALANDRPVRMLYVSDFDPSGFNMPVAAARKVEFLNREYDLDIQLRPVVLTHDQCGSAIRPVVLTHDQCGSARGPQSLMPGRRCIPAAFHKSCVTLRQEEPTMLTMKAARCNERHPGRGIDQPLGSQLIHATNGVTR